LQNNFKPSLITLKNISFAYDKELVLEDINLQIYANDFLAIIGPNGGGKSTLLKLILGILTPNKGSITKTSSIGYVPQNTNINTDFPIKVIEVVMMAQGLSKRRLFGYPKEDIIKAKEILAQVGMAEYADKKIALLSGGQRQRVMIARALFSNPKVLILDEPTSSIDVEGQKQVYELFKQLNKDMTIIVVSHDISIIIGYASKVAHINKRLSYHDTSTLQAPITTENSHVCEVELLEMLGKCTC
jgi:zinc transport system ATP-binding protein